MEILLPLVFLMGLVLGWMLGLDSGKKMGQESGTRLEKAYWFPLVQELEKELRWEKARGKARQLEQEK